MADIQPVGVPRITPRASVNRKVVDPGVDAKRGPGPVDDSQEVRDQRDRQERATGSDRGPGHVDDAETCPGGASVCDALHPTQTHREFRSSADEGFYTLPGGFPAPLSTLQQLTPEQVQAIQTALDNAPETGGYDPSQVVLTPEPWTPSESTSNQDALEAEHESLMSEYHGEVGRYQRLDEPAAVALEQRLARERLDALDAAGPGGVDESQVPEGGVNPALLEEIEARRREEAERIGELRDGEGETAPGPGWINPRLAAAQRRVDADRMRAYRAEVAEAEALEERERRGTGEADPGGLGLTPRPRVLYTPSEGEQISPYAAGMTLFTPATARGESDPYELGLTPRPLALYSPSQGELVNPSAAGMTLFTPATARGESDPYELGLTPRPLALYSPSQGELVNPYAAGMTVRAPEQASGRPLDAGAPDLGLPAEAFTPAPRPSDGPPVAGVQGAPIPTAALPGDAYPRVGNVTRSDVLTALAVMSLFAPIPGARVSRGASALARAAARARGVPIVSEARIAAALADAQAVHSATQLHRARTIAGRPVPRQVVMSSRPRPPSFPTTISDWELRTQAIGGGSGATLTRPQLEAFEHALRQAQGTLDARAISAASQLSRARAQRLRFLAQPPVAPPSPVVSRFAPSATAARATAPASSAQAATLARLGLYSPALLYTPATSPQLATSPDVRTAQQVTTSPVGATAPAEYGPVQAAAARAPLAQQLATSPVGATAPAEYGPVQAAAARAPLAQQLATSPQLAAAPEVRTSPQLATSPAIAAAPEVRTAPQLATAPDVRTSPQLATAPEIAAAPEVRTSPQLATSPAIAAAPEVRTAPQLAAAPEIAAAPEVRTSQQVATAPEIAAVPRAGAPRPGLRPGPTIPRPTAPRPPGPRPPPRLPDLPEADGRPLEPAPRPPGAYPRLLGHDELTEYRYTPQDGQVVAHVLEAREPVVLAWDRTPPAEVVRGVGSWGVTPRADGVDLERRQRATVTPDVERRLREAAGDGEEDVTQRETLRFWHDLDTNETETRALPRGGAYARTTDALDFTSDLQDPRDLDVQDRPLEASAGGASASPDTADAPTSRAAALVEAARAKPSPSAANLAMARRMMDLNKAKRVEAAKRRRKSRRNDVKDRGGYELPHIVIYQEPR